MTALCGHVSRPLSTASALPENLQQILDSREARWQRRLILSRRGALLTMTLNVPGPEKNGEPWESLHNHVWTEVGQFLSAHGSKVLYEECRPSAAGTEGYLVSSLSARELKILALQFESQCIAGPLLDLDVMDNGIPLSRAELGYPPKKCFCCGEPAAFCASRRRHPLQQIIDAALAFAKAYEVSH